MSSAPTPNLYPTAQTSSMVAPVEGSSSFTTKRGPEDDIQFVSSKPVKKTRISRDSPPTHTQQGSGPANSFPPVLTPSAPVPGDRPAGASPGVGFGIHGSQPDPSMFYRGVSLPSMENYVFPQPGPGMASRTSRSSPMLSPKQLPPSSFPNHPTTQMPSGTSMTAPDHGSPMQPRNIVAQWEVSGMPLQKMTMHPEMVAKPPILLPPIQKLGTELTGVVQGEKQPAPGRPGTPKGQKPAFGPDAQPKEPHAEDAQRDHLEAPYKTSDTLRTTQSFVAQASWLPSPPNHQHPPPPPMSQPQYQMRQEASGSNSYAVTAAQSAPPKPPCLACEQIRQQAFLNKTTGYQGVHYPHVHNGWHGPGMPHSQPTHMLSPPMSSPGFTMGPNITPNQQHKFQHVPQGHIPTNYALAQVPGQIPVQMALQRGAPMANMAAMNEAYQGGPPNTMSHHHAIGNAGPLGPGASQAAHHKYVQSHFPPSHPPATAPKSTAAQPPPPSSPRTPRMPTPPPPQKHSPNLIVDIAETCEDLFPWDQVAERHSVPRQKVVETFAAVIQLPLLRCTTDKRRHGRLATNRLKDYTRVKNATKTSSPSSASSSTTAPRQQQQQEATNTEDRPVLPGVMELASSMSPLGLPSSLTNRFPGPW